MKPAICVFAFTLLSTAVLAWGSPAQQKPATPDAPKAPLQLAISSQGKEVADVDIVITLVHSGGGGLCGGGGGGGMPACEAADHWQAKVKVGGKGGAEKTFALTKKEDLRKHLEGIGARKIRIKHADTVSISKATLSLRVAPGAPYGLVQGLVATAANAGITQVEFAVVPGAAAAEQRLAVPMPLDEASKVVKAKADEGLRIVLRIVNEKRECERQLGTAKFATGDAGDLGLRDRIKKSTVDKEAPAIIAAERGVPWQAVVGVVDACHEAGRVVLFANPDLLDEWKKTKSDDGKR